MVRIGEQHHFLDPQVRQDLRAHAIIAQFLDFGRARALALGTQLHEARDDALHRAVDHHDHARAFLRDHLHRGGKQPGALGRFAEHIDEEAGGMHPHQRRLGGIDLALHQRDRLVASRLVVKRHRLPLPAPARFERHFRLLLDQMVVAAAIGDQVTDRADLQIVELRERHQIVHPRHGAVLVHDLADHARGVEASQPRHVHRRFGMARAHQHTAIARDQWENVARGHDLLAALGRIDRHRDRAGAVGGGNAGGHPIARLDRDGKGRLVPRAVVAAHQVEAQRVDARLGHGEADQPAPVPRHKIDLLRRRHLRRDHQIALVLAILVIHQDEHATVLRLVDDLFGAGEKRVAQAGEFSGLLHDNVPSVGDSGRAHRSRC